MSVHPYWSVQWNIKLTEQNLQKAKLQSAAKVNMNHKHKAPPLFGWVWWRARASRMTPHRFSLWHSAVESMAHCIMLSPRLHQTAGWSLITYVPLNIHSLIYSSRFMICSSWTYHGAELLLPGTDWAQWTFWVLDSDVKDRVISFPADDQDAPQSCCFSLSFICCFCYWFNFRATIYCRG